MSALRQLVALSALAVALGSQAADKGYLGISVTVDGEGFFLNPTLKSVKVASVLPGSPAAKAGLSEGDAIVEIDGKPVIGAKANELQAHMQPEVGQPVRLVVRKASGEVKSVSVVAGPKPE